MNYRAKIDALKRCGVTDVVAISAVGSLREQMAPGEFVAVDQFIDRTSGNRERSFFGTGLVAHVPLTDAVSPRLSRLAADSVCAAGRRVHRGGCYVTIEGPQFSTRAESRMYRQWDGDVIGMTAMPEARLAREAELSYALIGMITDWDCWREDGDVDVGGILEYAARQCRSGTRQPARARRLVAAKSRAKPDRHRARRRHHHPGLVLGREHAAALGAVLAPFLQRA